MSCTEQGTSSVERALIQHAKKKKVPINGSLELLPLCNMNCEMCYVRLDRAEMEQQGRLRTATEWLEVGRQMKDAGVLFLLLTGGEPLLFPDFKNLYLELRKMGFVLTLNSNGTLIDEEWAAFFGENPPRRINITLYGAEKADYQRLCHYPDGFEKTIQGIRLLLEHGVDVKVSFSITKANHKSMEKVFAIGEELQVPVHIDPYMMPAERERSRSFAMQSRVLPEEAAAASLRALKLQFPKEIYDQYVEQTIARVEDPTFPRGDGHISCLAGNCSFTINWQGLMRPCVVMSKPSFSVFDKGFAASWDAMKDITQKRMIHENCTKCKYKPICKVCVAASDLETGSYDGIPEYLCRYCEEYYRLLQEERQDGSNISEK